MLTTLLVVGGALEELLPKFWGYGVPLLLAASVLVSVRARPVAVILFAIAAGAFEDSLSGLAPLTSASFFTVVAVLTRWTRIPKAALVLSYPAYLLWLRVVAW